ncbi:MAG: hypothetical protein SPE01_03580 [Candidatus Spyradocola sp.]|nr:hypothetical protein [Candidatus Spyradocola sp.]
MGNSVELSPLEAFFRRIVQKYNHKKYWKYRSIVVDPSRGSKIGDLFRLYYIKRADAFHNASMGTHRNFGAAFAEPPQLPHGLNGIIVSHNAVIGKDCRIYHQVTIGEGHNGAPEIGDHVVIGAGTKIVGKVTVGSYAKIGAGCVIMQDIPEHALVLAGAPSIIVKERAPSDS